MFTPRKPVKHPQHVSGGLARKALSDALNEAREPDADDKAGKPVTPLRGSVPLKGLK